MRQNKLILVFTIFYFLISLSIFGIFNPLLPIFGFVHEIESSSGNFITITQTTLLNVLNDNFYSQNLKIWYRIYFLLQIFSLLFIFISVLIINITNKEIPIFCLNSFLLILEDVLTILLFKSEKCIFIVYFFAFFVFVTFFAALINNRKGQ